jgi:hypothetical protein
MATAIALTSWMIGSSALADGTDHQKKGQTSASGAQQQPQQQGSAGQPSTSQQSAQAQPGTLEPQYDSVAISDLDEAEVRKLQTALQEQGYYQGTVDGKVGNQTRRALQRFYADQARLALRGMIRTDSASTFDVDASDVQPVRGRDESNGQQSLRGQESRNQGSPSGRTQSGSMQGGAQSGSMQGGTQSGSMQGGTQNQGQGTTGTTGRGGASGSQNTTGSQNRGAGTNTGTGTTGTGTQPGGVSP